MTLESEIKMNNWLARCEKKSGETHRLHCKIEVYYSGQEKQEPEPFEDDWEPEPGCFVIPHDDIGTEPIELVWEVGPDYQEATVKAFAYLTGDTIWICAYPLDYNLNWRSDLSGESGSAYYTEPTTGEQNE